MIRNGFTLIEMVVVLAIISILLFFAYPAYDVMMQKMEAHIMKRHIHEAIRLAKIESYARGKDVIICPMSGDVCSKTAQDSIVVFVDNNSSNRFDQKDEMISKQNLTLKYGIIQVRVSAGRDYMKFMGDTGKPRGNFGHINYCNLSKDSQGAYSFQVVINSHGMISDKRGDRIKIDC